MAKTPEEVQAQLDEELSKLLALRESILGSEIKNYNDLIRDRKELQDKEEQLNQDKNDALKMQEDANEDLKKKQDELNSTQETLNDEQLTNLKNEISNLENEAKTAQQLHDDTITELQTRQDSLNTFNDSINAFDEKIKSTEGFAEQEQIVQNLEDENQSFKESVSKFSDTINSFYQSLTGTAIAPTGEEPSWVKVIVGAILSIVPTTDPLQLEKSDEKPTTDPFLAEKAREEQTAIEKAQETYEQIEENTRGMAEALEKEEDEKKLLQEYRRIGAQEGQVYGSGNREYGGAIPTEKRYDHGGVHYDSPEEDPTRRELRKQKREDEEGMIPARFRNRGQEGLDAYRTMMRRRRDRKGLGIMDALRELFQKNKGATQKEEGHCIGGNCGQFG